jgi:hypothetical protein
MSSISSERHQEQTGPMMYASVNTIQSSKRAIDCSEVKDGDLLNKHQHPWNHSIDRKHTFFHAKIEGGLTISLKRKSTL